MIIPPIKRVLSLASASAPRVSQRRLWVKVWPWLVAVTILGFLVNRIPREDLVHAIEAGPWVVLGGYTLLQASLVLLADSYAISVSLAVAGFRQRFSEVFLARGASYILGILNYALGQGAFGLYLRRSGIKTVHVAGVLFFLMGVNLGVLLFVVGLGLMIGGYPWSVQLRCPPLGWGMLLGAGAYLAVIGLKPRFLQGYQLLIPLWQAGFWGHMRALAARLPHVLFLVLSYWGALRLWGIPVPLPQGMVSVSLVLLVSALPIVPMGLGTTQAAVVLLFSSYAPFATPATQAAAVLAFSLTYYLMGATAQTVLSLWCLPKVTVDRQGQAQTVSANDTERTAQAR